MSQGSTLLDAVKKTQERLEGTWGLAILDKDNPDQLIAVKNGSPLLVGIGQGRTFIASESAAFSRYTKEFIGKSYLHCITPSPPRSAPHLENGFPPSLNGSHLTSQISDLEDREVAVVTAKGHSLDRSRILLAPQEKIELSPAPWPHWTIKEIMEQPAAISRALNYGGRIIGTDHIETFFILIYCSGSPSPYITLNTQTNKQKWSSDESSSMLGGLEANKEILKDVKHLVIAACGTSYYAGIAGAQYMRYLGAFKTIQGESPPPSPSCRTILF